MSPAEIHAVYEKLGSEEVLEYLSAAKRKNNSWVDIHIYIE